MVEPPLDKGFYGNLFQGAGYGFNSHLLHLTLISAIADLVGWVKERNPTSILLLESVCWVSFYSTQPTVLGLGIGEFASEVTGDFFFTQRRRDAKRV